MPVIKKINKYPMGEIVVGFSLQTNQFTLTLPKDVTEKISYKGSRLFTWSQVEEEIEAIHKEYIGEVLLNRKVIVIQIRTSESMFNITKKNMWAGHFNIPKDGMETKVTDDYLNDSEGFKLMWHVCNEYKYPSGDLYYEVLESNENNNKKYRLNILHQVFSSSDGEIRLLDYREDLHEYLKNLDVQIASMLQKMIAYFDIDNAKFINNFEKQQLKLGNG